MNPLWLACTIGLCVVGTHCAAWLLGCRHGRRQEKRLWRRWLRSVRTLKTKPRA